MRAGVPRSGSGLWGEGVGCVCVQGVARGGCAHSKSNYFKQKKAPGTEKRLSLCLSARQLDAAFVAAVTSLWHFAGHYLCIALYPSLYLSLTLP